MAFSFGWCYPPRRAPEAHVEGLRLKRGALVLVGKLGLKALTNRDNRPIFYQ
jgi:hypothetical protein